MPFFPPLFIPLIAFWSVGSVNVLLLGWKLSGCQLAKPFPKPSPCSLCSCSRTQRHCAQESHQMFPLSTLLSAPDLLSQDTRFCPGFIGIFFMFCFIVWCPLYENNPLKMLMLEENAVGSAWSSSRARGEKRLSNNRTAGLWHRCKDKQTYFPGAWKMFGNRAISWITRLSIMLFQPLELLFPLQESEMLLWIREGYVP